VLHARSLQSVYGIASFSFYLIAGYIVHFMGTFVKFKRDKRGHSREPVIFESAT
jgi:hypothetical protein